MDTVEIKGRINALRKQSEEKKHERKLLATDYEKLKMIVKRSGITALITLLVHSVILNPWANNNKHVMLISLGRFLTPFALIIFVVSFVIFLIKGFDLFVNADNRFSKMAAEKFKVNRVSETLKFMNEAITMMDVEIDKLENTLYENGESFDGINEPTPVNTKSAKEMFSEKTEFSSEQKSDFIQDLGVNKKDVVISASEKVERPVVERTIIEMPKKESVDDIFSGLDSLAFADDDEDEFESSSEMWEREAKKNFK